MKIIKSIWNWIIKFHQKSREGMKITNSIKTSFKCPKCKSILFQIAYAKSYDQSYFCKKCKYEGTVKI